MTKISNESGYEAALVKVWSLMHAMPDSPEERELRGITYAIFEYERVHHPIDPPTPVEAIKFRMEQASPQGKARLIAEVGGEGARQIGDDVSLTYAGGAPLGNMQVRATGVAVHLYGVSPLLALEIARLVKQEREPPETTLTIGSSKDTADGYIHADDEIFLTGPIGIDVTPQADLHVVGRVYLADVLDDNQSSLLARPLLDRFVGKTVEVTVRVLVGGEKGDGVIVDEAAEGFPHGKGEEK